MFAVRQCFLANVSLRHSNSLTSSNLFCFILQKRRWLHAAFTLNTKAKSHLDDAIAVFQLLLCGASDADVVYYMAALHFMLVYVKSRTMQSNNDKRTHVVKE